MIKILFLIHDLGQGGAEKVLVNLLNNLDKTKFDVTLMVLFGGGIHENSLDPSIKLIRIFKKMIPGNSIWLKLATPRQLHRMFIHDKYDIEIAYLEGPSARIISGCSDKKTKLISWIHSKQSPMKQLSRSFRSEREARICYSKFDNTICVSEDIKNDFCQILNFKKNCEVLYNTVESKKIIDLSKQDTDIIKDDVFKIIAVGTLKEIKGYDRLLRVINRLIQENYKIHLYILGQGPLKQQMEDYILANHITNNVTLLGFQTNPYKYVSKCNLFVCSSYSEGFSTATTEALIVGTPVCTVDVSGMRELLGNNNEYGVIVPNNTEDLYQGIKSFLDNPEKTLYYKEMAMKRGCHFSTEQTTAKVEEMLKTVL